MKKGTLIALVLAVGVGSYVSAFECPLVRKQDVDHREELSLIVGCNRSLRRQPGVRVKRQRIVSNVQTDLAGVIPL